MTKGLLLPNKSTGAHRAATSGTSRAYLRYVDGLRGVAILMVVIFHLFVFKVSSGVDVFLFLGGLFIVQSQVSNFVSPNGLTFTQAILRVVRRLAPALIVVVGVTTLFLAYFYPPSDWWGVFQDATAAVTYSTNWFLGLSGDEYTKIGDAPSAFQHLWSMSVQMQIYLCIIIIVYLLCGLAGGRTHKEARTKATRYSVLLIAVLSVASFIYALHLHTTNQTLNYYSTFSRMWEIGFGVIVGYIFSQGVVFTRWIRITLSTLGFAMLSFTGIFLDGAQQFPGPWTLVPLLGAAFIVMSGRVESSEGRTPATLGLVWLLETRPLIFIGKIAYSLYLWHWVIGIMLLETDNLYVQEYHGFVTIALSILAAYISHKVIEDPLRQKGKPNLASVWRSSYAASSWRRSNNYARVMSVVLVSAMISIVSAQGVYSGIVRQQAVRAEKASEFYGGFFNAYPGARSIIPGIESPEDVGIQPSPNSDVFNMMPPTWYDSCYTWKDQDHIAFTAEDGRPCAYGDLSSTKTLYAAGGSHTEQYITALDNIGKKRNVRIIPIIKMGCPLVNEGRIDGREFSDCDRWSYTATQWILDNPPTEGIFITSTRPSTIPGLGPDHVPESYVNLFRTFSQAGIPIYAVRDNPWIMVKDPETRQPMDVQLNAKTCISSGRSAEDCGMAQGDALSEQNPALKAYEGIPGIQHIDFTPLFCQDGVCRAVIGNVLVYRDSNHLTDVFIKSMEPFIESALFEHGWDAEKVGEIITQLGEQDIKGEDRDLPQWASTVVTNDQGESRPFAEEHEIATTTVPSTAVAPTDAIAPDAVAPGVINEQSPPGVMVPAPEPSIPMEVVPDV